MKLKLKKNFFFQIFPIFTITIILLILISIFMYNKNKIELEYFIDVKGVQPNKSGTKWTEGNSDEYDKNDENRIIKVGSVKDQCELGSSCSNMDNWGIYNENCECISVKKKEIMIKSNTLGSGSSSSSTINKMNDTNLPPKDPNCMLNSTNFDAICKKKNPNYQVTNLIKCNDTESKPTCGFVYNDSEEDTITTPCLNKTDDFNTWCRFYSNKSVPEGYNVNSIGAKSVLVGAEGGCYVNGKSDNNKARGICTYNYTDEVIKLTPPNPDIDYNVFTQCKYMKGTDFIKECADLLKTDYINAFADQITSYDCNPGYARAKCLLNKDKLPYNNNYSNLDNMYPINTTQNTDYINSCKCNK